MELQARIVHHLRSITEPCTVVELAHALGILEPGDVVPERLRSTITGLVRHQQIKRIHNGDGVLRYAPMTLPATRIEPGPATPALAPAAAAHPAATTAAALPPTRHRYQTGVSERVLAAFEHSGVPVMRSALEHRIYPPLTSTQVLSALVALRKKGLVQRVGTTAAARWIRVDGSTADARVPTGTPSPVAAVPAYHLPLRIALLSLRSDIDKVLQALEA